MGWQLIKHVCHALAFISKKRREHWLLNKFGAIRLNQPVLSIYTLLDAGGTDSDDVIRVYPAHRSRGAWPHGCPVYIWYRRNEHCCCAAKVARSLLFSRATAKRST